MNLFYTALIMTSSLLHVRGAVQVTNSCKPTSPDVLGPYYLPGPPRRRQICDRDPAFHNERHLLVEGRIKDESCQPINGAKIEVWQADRDGHYILSENCRGYFYSEKNGHYAFLTLHPGKYSTDPNGDLYRPAHIHFRVQKTGYEILVTQMYFKGDSNLGRNDSCAACSSDQQDLIVPVREMCADTSGRYCFLIAHFDMVLKGGNGVAVIPDYDDSWLELEDIVRAGK